MSEETITLSLNASSPELPRELWQIKEPPEQLWVRGKASAFALLSRLPREGLAIVGTRRPQPRAKAALRAWIQDLAGSELVVLSGFARGIDGVAHEAALKAGLPTIAILATGLDRLYPPEHAELGAAILAAGGLLISESDPGESGRPHRFLQRNRIIAGWSQATLVVEAPARSGALNTASWAREHHRTCFAVPAFPGDPSMAGNQALLDRDHALPFWGGHSLGYVWLRLATHRPPAFSRAPQPTPRTDADIVTAVAHGLCFQTGGASALGLLDALIEQRWEPGRFFLALRQAVDTGRLREESGVFTPMEAGA